MKPDGMMSPSTTTRVLNAVASSPRHAALCQIALLISDLHETKTFWHICLQATLHDLIKTNPVCLKFSIHTHTVLKDCGQQRNILTTRAWGMRVIGLISKSIIG
jgi:hypothetical protein